MTDPSPEQPQPQATDNGTGQTLYTDSFIRRKVTVTGTGGVTATIAVVAQRGQVWVSIHPLFTWDAIMEPGKVDELVRILGLAQEDAKRMESSKRVARGGRQQSVGTVTALPEKRALGTKRFSRDTGGPEAAD